MDAAAFLADLEAKPTSLTALADRLDADDPWAAPPRRARARPRWGSRRARWARWRSPG